MTRWVAVIGVVMGMAIGAGSALAAEGHAHSAAEGTTQTITGEVIDLACYLDHGAQGAGHQACAQKCITSGLPVGIKSGDTMYLAVGSEHGPANAALAPLASKEVVVEGNVSERDGLHLIAVKKVTAKS